MFEFFQAYWKSFSERHREQVISFGLSTPILTLIPAFLFIIILHGSMAEGVTILLLLVSLTLLVSIPIFLLFLTPFHSRIFQIIWVMLKFVF
ncbi:hypothetical protein ACFP7A_08575 [Sporolactobacillus kofuensis]|uniref:Uncharacterized protein n=1 Tax=Sporolactobacillus kofuensis TaxID=269672 RepID=A0ABW1WF02_9BACL|nr:hypothetical protein [Sporolactobacillus kofuensis]MCO7176633.1 hypothetical protein [Sporolactobacillus kofuensis]